MDLIQKTDTGRPQLARKLRLWDIHVKKFETAMSEMQECAENASGALEDMMSTMEELSYLIEEMLDSLDEKTQEEIFRKGTEDVSYKKTD